MSSLDPVALTHVFAEDLDASGLVDIAQLDAQLDILAGGIDAHSDLFRTLLRGDLTLKDGLIRSRMLHPEVVSALQLIAQGVEANVAHILPTARVASTANITLSGTQTIDGVACIAGNVVLAKDQTDPAENGLWTVAAGAWTRDPDAAAWEDLLGGFVWVDEGTANEGTQWAVSMDEGGTIDIDPVAFVLLFRAASSLADLDPNALPIAVPSILADYFLFHDVSAGGLRRSLFSSLPFLPNTTDHGTIGGLSDDDHPQYHTNARGDARYAPLAHTHPASAIVSGIIALARLPDAVGATTLANGTKGLPAAAAIGERLKFWRGDNTYADPVADNTGVAKAWVVFAGSGSNGAQTILASRNVESVNRDSSGVYTITFTDGTFATANYAMIGTAKRTDNSHTVVVGEKDDVAPTTSAITIEVKRSNTDGDTDQFVDANPTRVSLAFFGA